MSQRSPRWLWLDTVENRVRHATLGPHAGYVAHVLAVRYINGSQEAWPSQRELAAATGLTDRTVREALHELQRNQLLDVRRGHPARTSGNVYRLTNPE